MNIFSYKIEFEIKERGDVQKIKLDEKREVSCLCIEKLVNNENVKKQNVGFVVYQLLIVYYLFLDIFDKLIVVMYLFLLVVYCLFIFIY